MQKKIGGTKKAFTLVEVVVAIAVFSILLLAVIGMSQQIHQVATLALRKTTAATIAQEQLETIRNMPYDQVGSDVTYPTGPLLSTQTVTRNSATFTVKIAINDIQDPADGLAPTDTQPADYKQVEVQVCWDTGSCIRPVRLTTFIVPKTLEYAANAGALFINVIDANGQPVNNATVQVTNATPAVNVINQTDVNGQLQYLDLPAATNTYHIVVTKNGYSSDSTLASSGSNPNPTNPDTTVVVSQVTNVTLKIDRISSLLVKGLDQTTCAGLGSVTVRIKGQRLIGTGPDVPAYDQTFTTDAAGQFLVANLPWDSYSLTISSAGDDVAGVTPPDNIVVNPGSSVTGSIVLAAHQTNSVRVIVRDAGTHAPIANANVSLTNGGSYTQSLVTDQGIIQQNNWVGGSGQTDFSDITKFATLSGATDTTNANSLSLGSAATPGSATETFDTTAKRDTGNTTANWNTSSGTIQLPDDVLLPGTYTASAVAQSVQLNSVTGIITSVTLTTNDVTNGQMISYQVTADGSTFENITPGVAHTFVTTGSDLRWRITMSTANPTVTPTVTSLTLNYSQQVRSVVDGTLTSSTFDNGGPTNYTTLSWEPTSQPPSAGSNAIRFQVATAGTTTSSGTPTVDQTSNPGTTPLFTKNIGDANNTRYLAQSFIAGTSDTIDSLDLKIAQHGTPSTSITAFIYSDVSGTPTDNLSGSGQTLSAGFPNDSSSTWQDSWTTQSFAPKTAIVAGTKYWLVLQVSGSNSSKYWTVVRSNVDTTYTTGTSKDGAALNS